MNIENIVIARKLSVLEYEQVRDDISFEEVVQKTRENVSPEDSEKVIRSHYNQGQSWRTVVTAVGKTEIPMYIVEGDYIPEGFIKSTSLVLALGGDNYFQNVSHYLDNQPIMGINSDPENSDGALTYFTADTFVDFIPKLQSGEFKTEEWTRLQATINGKRIPTLATSEIYIGAYKSTDMSRYTLELRRGSRGRVRESEEQKSSGLVFSTKAGETGWYDAASRYAMNRSMSSLERSVFYTDIMQRKIHKVHPIENPNFPERSAVFIAREPFVSDPEKVLRNYYGYIREKETINLTWLAHGKGLVSIDARDEHEIARGDEVKIEISSKPLRVVTP